MTIHIDLSDITDNLDLEDELTAAVIDDVQTKLGLDLLSGLQVATPVDTGEARNSWQLGGSGALTHVQSDSPYMGRLNDGHSKQAPAGFIENVIDDVVGRFK